MEEIGNGLTADIANVLRDEHVSTLTDGWTPYANDSHLSLTIAFITSGWELVILPLNCTKSQCSTKGDGLAETIESVVTRHDLTGNVVACTVRIIERASTGVI